MTGPSAPTPCAYQSPGGGLCWATWECLRNPVTVVFLLQVPCCRGRRCGDSQGLLLRRGNTILAWASTGFQSGERERPLRGSFPSTPSNGRAEMGEDSFRLNTGEILIVLRGNPDCPCARAWARDSKHPEPSSVPLDPKQWVWAPAFVPFLFP